MFRCYFDSDNDSDNVGESVMTQEGYSLMMCLSGLLCGVLFAFALIFSFE